MNMYEAPSIKIVILSTTEIICQSSGALSIDHYEEDDLVW